MNDAQAPSPPLAPDALKSLWEKTLPPGGTIDAVGPGRTHRGPTFGQPAAEKPRSTKSGWSVIGELGRGGMGIVFRAHQESLDRDIAIKKIRPEIADTDIVRRRFLAEAMVAGALDHPNIVPVHELSTDMVGNVFLAMKLVGGMPWKNLLHPETLAEREQSAASDLDRHLEILNDVGNAVAFAHSRGVVHADLKPENVMVGEFGEVLVMDWGVAVDIRHEPTEKVWAPHCSAVHEPVGTPSYMAPELAEGRGEDIGPWTDVYLLGAILHEIITGRPPHQAASLWASILSAAQSKPPVFDNSVPPELAAIVQRALARDPQERFATVGEFQRVLRDYVKHRESTAIERRACERLAAFLALGGSTGDAAGSAAAAYSELSEIVAAFEQAIVLWHGNAPARAGLARARFGFARTAFASHDFALAAAQIEKVEGPEAAQFLTEIRVARAAADEIGRSRRRLKRTLVASAVALIAVLSSGIFLVNRERTRADENAETAIRQRDEVERLADLRRLKELEIDAKDLWPAVPEKIDALKRWLARAAAVLARVPIHRATLARIEAGAQTASQPSPAPTHTSRHRDLDARITAIKRAITEEDAVVAEGGDAVESKNRVELFDKMLTDLNGERGADDSTASVPILAGLSVDELSRGEVLRELLVIAKRIDAPNSGLRHDVGARLALAETFRRRTIDDFKEKWRDAAERVKDDPRFGDLPLAPQLGLIPLGPDPRSRFEEFLHFASQAGPVAGRGADGRLVLDEDSGLILVLVPGGETGIGGQRGDPDGVFYDPEMIGFDAYLQAARLDPFFISKFEVSQAQWMRLMGNNPSLHHPGYDQFPEFKWSPLLPVESLPGFDAAVEFVKRWALELPTEAQWEYAARGGTDWPWWTGPTIETLGKSENVLDATAKRLSGDAWKSLKFIETVDDGALTPWSIYDGNPNPFGLHNVIGNVHEWCREPYSKPQYPFVDGSGERVVPPSDIRTFRGTSHKGESNRTHIGARGYNPATSRLGIGLRPVRTLAR